MVNPTVVLVTGANRGIGRAICDLLVSCPPVAPLRLYAASRKGEDFGLAKPADDRSEVLYPALDIGSRASISALAERIRQEQPGKLDVLINNAGINLDNQYTAKNAGVTLDVNYRGTLAMCQTFIPLLAKGGRIVNVSSVASGLQNYSAEIQQRFRDPGMTLDGLEHLAQDFHTSVVHKNERAAGFVAPGRAYSVSKACINALTAILAREHDGLVVNACCPGWVRTDMGALVGRPPKSVEDGAKIPIRLAFGDIGDVTGRYWANDSIRGKGDGKVQDW